MFKVKKKICFLRKRGGIIKSKSKKRIKLYTSKMFFIFSITFIFAGLLNESQTIMYLVVKIQD